MDSSTIVNALLSYISLVILLTFHEYGHAWMAWKCGDDTARLKGRCSLNPIVHIDPIGTVLMPLLMLLLPGAGRFLIGWAKPVPVNPLNLRNPRLDDILVSLAGPWMNLLLAVVLMGLARLGVVFHWQGMTDLCTNSAWLSLLLCFFNLIPIPPLDGSHILRNLIGMSYEAYWQFARFGFIAVILVLQIPFVSKSLALVTNRSLVAIGSWFGMATT